MFSCAAWQSRETCKSIELYTTLDLALRLAYCFTTSHRSPCPVGVMKDSFYYSCSKEVTSFRCVEKTRRNFLFILAAATLLHYDHVINNAYGKKRGKLSWERLINYWCLNFRAVRIKLDDKGLANSESWVTKLGQLNFGPKLKEKSDLVCLQLLLEDLNCQRFRKSYFSEKIVKGKKRMNFTAEIYSFVKEYV